MAVIVPAVYVVLLAGALQRSVQLHRMRYLLGNGGRYRLDA